MKQAGLYCVFRATDLRCDFGQGELLKIAKPDDFAVIRAQSLHCATKFIGGRIFFRNAVWPVGFIGDPLQPNGLRLARQRGASAPAQVIDHLVAHNAPQPASRAAAARIPSCLMPYCEECFIYGVFGRSAISGKNSSGISQEQGLFAGVKPRKRTFISTCNTLQRPFDVHRRPTDFSQGQHSIDLAVFFSLVVGASEGRSLSAEWGRKWGMQATASSDQWAVSVDDEARLITYNPFIVIGGQSVFFGANFLVWLYFRKLVPLQAMHWWMGLALGLLAIVIWFDVKFIAVRADSTQLLGFWRMFEKRHTMIYDLVAVGTIWLLLPYGDEWHRLVIGCYCIGHVPMQMISDPENVLGNRFSVFAVLGSFTLFLLRGAAMGGNDAMLILAAMVILYGAMLFYGAEAFRSVVVGALSDRRAAEAANSQLEAALNEVSSERDARSRFIAAAAHDLGQPLQAARLFVEGAQAASEAGKRDRALGKTVSTIQSAQAMLGHMLYHMRLEADAVQPISEPVALQALLSDLVARFQPQGVASGASIRLRCSEVAFQSDPVLIDRAISNLLQNALTHSGASQIILLAIEEPQHVAIFICDNGIGIDPQDETELFRDYRQGKRSASAVRGGFGLGLASVRRVAVLLGGSAEQVRRRRGATFLLRLRKMKDAE
jgi:two-component system, sensor histidine kinase